ncbi:hypothetical protein [Terrisporobacter mayombei]|uniref:Uncharacterized protein n=1 Tax=Terrisporobacter mayombei TaxID=1541 RepID=A0ABY9Q5L7_9FIRM|nr:hypothetical protein [Terrisporobacter mayombei]MCC3869775.1 hypothetical protein [Terrisporobacter mayombei]WMT83285.1 hypothetical protein TEMA_37960 [Terrisporobacter mayombei]
MNKKISKIFLIIVSLAMILIIFSLSFITKDKIDIEDVSGDRSALGDMNIVYQKRKGMYETDNIIISKDKEKVEKNVKEGITSFTISKENIGNRELLQMSNDKSNICETDDEITNVSLLNTYSPYSGDEMTVYIDKKDKKSSKIKNYEIIIDDTINVNGDSVYKALPMRDNDNIYLAIISSVYDDSDQDENKSQDSEHDVYKQTYLSLFKLNLSSQQSKCILTKSYDPNEMYTNGDVGFVKDNVAYFVTHVKDEVSKEINTCLFGFNIITKEINIINLGVENQNITNYSIDGNEVLLSCDVDPISKRVKTLAVDLDNKKIISTNEIDAKSKDDYNRYILEMRRYNDKTYLIMCDYKEDDYVDGGNGSPDMDYYIYVINEKNNEILYTGKIKEKIMYNIAFGIVKDEEL